MVKETIKISQEINFNGMPTWISIGASLQEGDSVVEGLQSLQKDINDYQDAETKTYKKSIKSVDSNVKDMKESPINNMITAIQGSSSIKVLESFNLIVKNKPELQDIYNETLKKLQHVA